MSAPPGRRSEPELTIWPWSPRVAILLVPVVLVALIAAVAITRAVAGWPSQQYQGWALLAIVVLSLVPVILLLAQTLATRGGTIQLPGVSLSFASVSQELASAVQTTTLAANLGTPDDVPVAQSSMPSILRALRGARDSEVTVLDLRRGRTWWESRLFILVAGAARRGRPQAIAFIADRNGKSGAYIGWAPPARLLDIHMAADPFFAQAYETALSRATQWQIGNPHARQPGSTPYVTLPWSNTQFNLPAISGDSPNPEFALELFLQEQLDHQTEIPQQYVTIQRVLDLYEAVLMTDHVDVDADDAAWARLLASSPRRYFALVNADAFKALVPRESLLAALVARLVEADNQSALRATIRP